MVINKELKLLLKLQKTNQSSPGWGVRVDVNDEMQKKKRRKKGLGGVLFEGGGWKN